MNREVKDKADEENPAPSRLRGMLRRSFRAVRSTRWSTRALLLALICAAIFAASGPATAASESVQASASVLTQSSDVVEADSTIRPPSEYRTVMLEAGNLFQANRYMVFERWRSATEVPSPDQSFSSMAQIPSAMISGIAKLLLSGAALIAYVLGFMLTVSLSIDLMSKAIYFVDGVVGKAAFGAFGLGGGSSDLVWTILMFAGALFLCKYVPARLKGESTRLAWKDLGTVVVILSLFIGMAFQSTKNHYDPSIPGSGTAPVAQSEASSTVLTSEEGSMDPSDWAGLSPGWLVVGINKLAGWGMGWLSSAVNTVTNAVDSSVNPTDQYGSACDRYIDGMHAIYLNTAAGQAAGGRARIMVSFDNLVKQLYFYNYQSAALGTNMGASNAWCRFAENQAGSATGDQILIARVAGLYSELIGTGGLGVIGGDPEKVSDPSVVATNKDTGSRNVPVSNGHLVDAEGDWIDGQSKSVAERIFGPSYYAEKTERKDNVNGSTMSVFYFAACVWNEIAGPVSLNKEWLNAGRGSVDKFDPNDKITDASVCGVGGSEKDDTQIWSQGFGPNYEASNTWNYWNYNGDASLSLPIVGNVWGMNKSAADQQFDSAPEANITYQKVIGGSSGNVLVLGLTSLVLLAFLARYFVSLVAGVAIAQLIGVLILLVLPLIPVLLVFPGARMKHIFMTLAKTFLSSLLVVYMVGIAFEILFAALRFVTALLPVRSLDTEAGAILSGFACIAVFFVMKSGLSRFAQMDIGDFKSTAIKIGGAAGSPILGAMGLPTHSLFDASFWGGTGSDDTRNVTTDEDKLAGQDDHKNDDMSNLMAGSKTSQSATKWNAKALENGYANPLLNGVAGLANGAGWTKGKYTESKPKVASGLASARDGLRYLATGVESPLRGSTDGEARSRKDDLVDSMVDRPDLSAESKASAGLPSVDPSDSDSKVAKRTGASSAKGESRLAPDEVNDALRVEELAASSSGRTTSAPLERDGSVAIMSPEITTMLATQADAMAKLRSASRAMSETFDPSNLNLNDLFADRNVVGRELAAQSNAMADVARIIEETQRSLTEGMESVSGTARSLGDAQAETNRLIGESHERASADQQAFAGQIADATAEMTRSVNDSHEASSDLVRAYTAEIERHSSRSR